MGRVAFFTTTRAGFPMATEYAGMSVTTTLLTPMMAPSPTVTPLRMNEFCPIQLLADQLR